MKLSSAAFLLMTLSGANFIVTQSAREVARPSAELKKQDYFVGTWTLEGTTKSSPFGPGGQKFKSTEQLEWMPGGFFLLVHSYTAGKLAGVTVIGYDSQEKVFTHTSFNSTGETELWKGTAENDRWEWTRDETLNGKLVQERLAIKKISPNSYSFLVVMRPAEGSNWSTVAEGTGTKTS